MRATHCIDSNGVPYQVFGDDKRKRKPRQTKHERLLKALLSSCQVNKVGCLVTNDIGGFFGGLTREQERELIKIKESMK